MTEREAASLLALLPATGPARVREAAARCGGFANLLAGRGELPPSLAGEVARWREEVARSRPALEERAARLAAAGIQILPLTDPLYPSLLREIPDPPPWLFVRGRPEALSLPQIAIVGSRRASRFGLAQAERFAAQLAAGGFAITSGLAVGIDAAAHRGALRTGVTVAVLGSGLARIYPRQHRELAEEIVAGGGALVAELPPEAPPLPHHFPRRNRILSGLALGVLVVEAAAQSGSLITARHALEQGREVFAVPGSLHNPLSRGCHRLIREGAVLVECAADLVAELGGLLEHKAEELAPPAPTCRKARLGGCSATWRPVPPAPTPSARRSASIPRSSPRSWWIWSSRAGSNCAAASTTAPAELTRATGLRRPAGWSSLSPSFRSRRPCIG
ncbi:MAG: DNA processing protein DprA [Porticoccaceae bacterium]|nr:MAG: DNA processing protein DprA [Porticoccaceae bacterium]